MVDLLRLPEHGMRRYDPAGVCIYCGASDDLTDEHIIPYSAGGQWILPRASCRDCAKITGAFEGELSRTILGPLRMLYSLPTRRPQKRPNTLPLRVKYTQNSDWEIVDVDRNICPFLVGLPLYPLPEKVSGVKEVGIRSEATGQIWIRGGNFWPDRDAHLQFLCNILGASSVMPEAAVTMKPFCLTLAKIGHSFAAAELGIDYFEPYLSEAIRNKDMLNRAEFIGGGRGDEEPIDQLHQLNFVPEECLRSNIIVVRVRLLAILGAPTYFVVIGKKR